MLRARLLVAAKTKLRDPERACLDGLVPPKTPSIGSAIQPIGDRTDSGASGVKSYSWWGGTSGLDPMAVGNRSEVWKHRADALKLGVSGDRYLMLETRNGRYQERVACRLMQGGFRWQ